MKIIDTRTGREIKPNERFSVTEAIIDLDGKVEINPIWYFISKIDERLLKASALVESNQWPGKRWIPLVVRYMHPEYIFRKIGFFPS